MELFDEFDMNKLSLRKKGKKFDLYRKIVEHHLDTIKKGIENSENGIFRINKEDLTLNGHLKDNGIERTLRGFRVHLWDHNIYVYIGTRSDKTKFALMFRQRFNTDYLPDYR